MTYGNSVQPRSAEAEILFQLQLLPLHLQKEVLDYIGYLLEKNKADKPRKVKTTTSRAAPDLPISPEPAKRDFSKYRGCLSTNLSIEAIDEQLAQ